MKKLKRILITLFLLVGMSFFYQSCQKDQIIGNTSNGISNSNSTIKKVSFDELKAKVSLEKSLKLIEGKLDLNKSRDITSNDGSFTIMTDEIFEASNGLYTSYTFRLKTPTDPLSTFENFVLYPNSNNSFDYYLYKFKYNSNLPKEFPYDVSYFLVDANQIDTENFNNLKTMGYYIDNSGCLMYGYMICLGDADCFIATPITVWCPGGVGGSSSSGDSGTTGGSGSSGPTGTNTAVEGGTGGSTGYSGGGGVGTSNSGSNQTVSTTPIALNIPYTETVLQALSLTNNLTSEIQAWIENPVNYLNVKKLATFLPANNNSPEAVGFVNDCLNTLINSNISEQQLINLINYYNVYSGQDCQNILNILNTHDSDEVKTQNLIDFFEANTPIINSVNPITYEVAIKNMTNYMRQFGYPNLVPFADYIDSLIPEFVSFTMRDVENIYQITRKQYNVLRAQYLIAVIYPVAEAMIPFIQFAIVDATLGAALPLLNKIPLSMVRQGSKLEQFVIMVSTKMGIPFSPTIRNIYGSNIQRAERLFANLTKDAVSIAPANAEGTIVANMGNNSYLTFRTQSSTGAFATIDFNFPLIFGPGASNIHKLKFFP